MSIKKYEIAKEWRRGVAASMICSPISKCDNNSPHFLAGWRFGRGKAARSAVNKYLKSIGEEPMELVTAVRMGEIPRLGRKTRHGNKETKSTG